MYRYTCKYGTKSIYIAFPRFNECSNGWKIYSTHTIHSNIKMYVASRFCVAPSHPQLINISLSSLIVVLPLFFDNILKATMPYEKTRQKACGSLKWKLYARKDNDQFYLCCEPKRQFCCLVPFWRLEDYKKKSKVALTHTIMPCSLVTIVCHRRSSDCACISVYFTQLNLASIDYAFEIRVIL